MTDSQAARARLLAERDRAAGRLRDLEQSFTDIVEATRDSNVDDEHDPEGATIAVERQLVSSLADATRAQLVTLEAALDRVDAGTYGTGEQCGRPIGAARLEARPAATRCIACA